MSRMVYQLEGQQLRMVLLQAGTLAQVLREKNLSVADRAQEIAELVGEWLLTSPQVEVED